MVTKRRGHRQHPRSSIRRLRATVQLLHPHGPQSEHSNLAACRKTRHARPRIPSPSPPTSSVPRTLCGCCHPRVHVAVVCAGQYDHVGNTESLVATVAAITDASTGRWRPSPPREPDERRGAPPGQSPPTLQGRKDKWGQEGRQSLGRARTATDDKGNRWRRSGRTAARRRCRGVTCGFDTFWMRGASYGHGLQEVPRFRSQRVGRGPVFHVLRTVKAKNKDF